MRLHGKLTYSSSPDLTPLIDCTFQLVVFFLLTLNFSSAEQSELIRLPSSELAKPTEGALEMPITLQILSSGMVLFAGDQMTPDALQGALRRERDAIRNVLGRNIKNATIVIRADRDVATGVVQKIIRMCQDTDFERFVLRAKWERK
ncbi:MAG: biopolymer transporter ExbD [Pirellulales bacterium]|nr:biopolymer transporter ExbD [Pirellulales bacterium]